VTWITEAAVSRAQRGGQGMDRRQGKRRGTRRTARGEATPERERARAAPRWWREMHPGTAAHHDTAEAPQDEWAHGQASAEVRSNGKPGRRETDGTGTEDQRARAGRKCKGETATGENDQKDQERTLVQEEEEGRHQRNSATREQGERHWRIGDGAGQGRRHARGGSGDGNAARGGADGLHVGEDGRRAGAAAGRSRAGRRRRLGGRESRTTAGWRTAREHRRSAEVQEQIKRTRDSKQAARRGGKAQARAPEPEAGACIIGVKEGRGEEGEAGRAGRHGTRDARRKAGGRTPGVTAGGR